MKVHVKNACSQCFSPVVANLGNLVGPTHAGARHVQVLSNAASLVLEGDVVIKVAAFGLVRQQGLDDLLRVTRSVDGGGCETHKQKCLQRKAHFLPCSNFFPRM